MEREFSLFMRKWLYGSARKPLVIRGARQVGKTWLVRDFAVREKRILMEVNFERNPEHARHFESSNPREIFDNLGLILEKESIPEEAILFLDEIQNAPEVIAKLRWFAEEMPELAVVAAGSLLEFALKEFAHSVPVGRIHYAHVEPLTFAEFLSAHGQATLRKRLEKYQVNVSLAPAVHELATKWFYRFMMVGGMPEVVAMDAAEMPADASRAIQRDLIQTYRDDFAKYSGRLEHRVLDQVLHAIVRSLGEKFVYSHVATAVKHQQAKAALELLAMARLCELIPHTAGNGLPLAAEVNERIRKVALLDIGLAHGLWNTPAARRFPPWEEVAPQIRGGLIEQMAAQQLRSVCGTPASPGQVFHWRREAGRPGEIDYLVEIATRILPVEVKSGAVGAMKSLHQFMFEKRLDLAIRLNGNPPSVQRVNVKTTRGDPASYTLINLPHYFTWRLRELLARFL